MGGVAGASSKARSASFRGVPFGVFDASDQRGRNVAIHEFPLRDKVYVEDMGPAKRTINLNAFVLGDDFASKRDALIGALEEEGPGTLVHPWMGTMNVALAAPAEITHNSDSLRIALFSLSFVECEAPESPGEGLHSPTLSSISAGLAKVQACLDFDLMFYLRPVAEDALSLAHEWAEGLEGIFSPIYEAFSAFPVMADTVSVFLGQAVSLGNSISSLVKGFWPDRSYKGSGGGTVAMKEAGPLLRLSLESPPIPIPSGLGTVRSQIAANKAAIADFQREMSGAEGLVASAWARPSSSEEAKELRDLILEATDQMLENATSDEFYRHISRARDFSLLALALAAKKAPDVVKIELETVTPCFPFLWREVLLDSASNDIEGASDELISRNRVRHPGFIPPGEVEVRLV